MTDLKTRLEILKEISDDPITTSGYLVPAQWHIRPDAYFDMFSFEESEVENFRNEYTKIETTAHGVSVFCLVEARIEEKDGWTRNALDVPDWWKEGREKPEEEAEA